MKTQAERLEQSREAEAGFVTWCKKNKWETLRNGWPDFLCIHKGRVMCVEVKSGNSSMTKAQRELMAVLLASGIPCYTWTPEQGFVALNTYRIDIEPKPPRKRYPRISRARRKMAKEVMEERTRLLEEGVIRPTHTAPKGPAGPSGPRALAERHDAQVRAT